MTDLTEYITIPRSEYDRLRRADRQYGAAYEAKAAEMRRMIDQAHEQLAVGVKDMNTAIARIKELEEALKEAKLVTPVADTRPMPDDINWEKLEVDDG